MSQTLPSTMRVVEIAAFGPPERLAVGHRAVPAPTPGSVLVKVAGAGVNRADVMQRRGQYPPPKGASDLLGLEVSGTVAAVGDDVSTWTVGDRVCGLVAGGGYAEYCVRSLSVSDSEHHLNLLGRIDQGLSARGRVALIRVLHRDRHNRAGLQVDRVLGLVSASGHPSLRDFRVGIVRMLPVVVRALVLPLAIEARHVLARADAAALPEAASIDPVWTNVNLRPTGVGSGPGSDCSCMAQRIGRPPRDRGVGEPFEVPEQQHAEIATRRQAGTTDLVGVKPSTAARHTHRKQDLIQSPVERMRGTPRQVLVATHIDGVARRRCLPIAMRDSVVRGIDRVDPFKDGLGRDLLGLEVSGTDDVSTWTVGDRVCGLVAACGVCVVPVPRVYRFRTA